MEDLFSEFDSLFNDMESDQSSVPIPKEFGEMKIGTSGWGLLIPAGNGNVEPPPFMPYNMPDQDKLKDGDEATERHILKQDGSILSTVDMTTPIPPVNVPMDMSRFDHYETPEGAQIYMMKFPHEPKPQPDYTNMPQGMKEAQQMNGVRDHGLNNKIDWATPTDKSYDGNTYNPLEPKNQKLVKGDFVKHGDKVKFMPNDKGCFTVIDPNKPNEATKDLIRRRFPNSFYYGTLDTVVYDTWEVLKPEPVKEPEAPEPQPDLYALYEEFLKGRRGHVSFDDFKAQYEAVSSPKISEVINEQIIPGDPLYWPTEHFSTEDVVDLFDRKNFEPIKAGIDPSVDGKDESCFVVHTNDDSTITIKTEDEFQKEMEKLAPFYNVHVQEETPADLVKKKTKVWVGIDPGKAGAIVAISDRGIVSKNVIPLLGTDVDPRGIYEILQELDRNYDCTVILEEVHSLHKMAANTNFSMGHTLGIILGIVVASQLRLIRVAPKAWQKEVWLNSEIEYLPKKPDQLKPSVNTKLTSMKAAHRLFPNADFRKSARSTNDHDGITDAVCLAEYGRRKNL